MCAGGGGCWKRAARILINDSDERQLGTASRSSDLLEGKSAELDGFSLQKESVPAVLVHLANFVFPGRSFGFFTISIFVYYKYVWR